MTRVTPVNTDAHIILHTDFHLTAEGGNIFISDTCILLCLSQLRINVWITATSTACVYVCVFSCRFLLALTFVAPQRSVCESTYRGLKGLSHVARGQLAGNEWAERTCGVDWKARSRWPNVSQSGWHAAQSVAQWGSGQLMSREKREGDLLSDCHWFKSKIHDQIICCCFNSTNC